MPVGWTILAVIIAGVAGTLANSAVVAALTPNTFGPLATSPGRLGVAVAVAALLPALYALTSGAGAAVAAIVALTLIPSLLAKFVFGIGAPWSFVLGVNAVYAVTAWVVYLGIKRLAPSSASR
jgi:glucan phosphoethanolaminetransferase (alkaline phosphatase superfamily)